RVVIYPVNADGSQASAQYISELHQAAFVPIETFFKEEGRNYAVQLSMPVEVSIAPAVSSRPPAAPAGGGKPEALLCSLTLRYRACWNYTHHAPKPDLGMFVSYDDPAERPRLSHLIGLQKGLIGVVNAFARVDIDGSNNVVIAHELVHAFGATDKYDFAN